MGVVAIKCIDTDKQKELESIYRHVIQHVTLPTSRPSILEQN
jgi:hypothetical protein